MLPATLSLLSQRARLPSSPTIFRVEDFIFCFILCPFVCSLRFWLFACCPTRRNPLRRSFHPLKKHFELLLKACVVIDSLELIRHRIVGQRVGGAGIFDVPQFDEHL